MSRKLFVGFKGKNNASGRLVQSLSPDHCLLTNSFGGIKKDIGSFPSRYDIVYLFGVDKNLEKSFRIERFAEKDGIRYSSALDLENLADRLSLAGISTVISERPTGYLCNEAYGQLLEKYHGNAVLIHIPTIRHFDEHWIMGIGRALY